MVNMKNIKQLISRLGQIFSLWKFTQHEEQNAVICGTSSGSIFLVNRGEATNPGDWPWLAALFVRTRSSIDFTCGGTLVSHTHIVTAAHCMKRPRVFTRQPRDVIVYLGRHKLFNFEEREEQVQVSGVSAIHLHPDWGVRGVKDADIAVLVLATRAEFTDHVRPACVSFSSEQPVPTADTPKAIRLPVVSEDTCKSTDSRFETLATNRTFCAGNRDGSGPCVGDSGGGFYTSFTLPGDQVRFQLTGIVSRTLKRPEDPDQCDLQNYVIFTDLYSYRFWLRDIAGSGPCVGDSGGGFYTSFTLPGDQVRFQLTGIVSRTLKRPEDPDQCDLQNYVFPSAGDHKTIFISLFSTTGRIWIFLLLLQFALVFANKPCGELLRRGNLIREGELEASVGVKLNRTDLNFYDHWEISITFTHPVELTVINVYVNGETGPVYHANGGVTSSAAPITNFESVESQSDDRLTF
ncbi:hypothetical protein B566_EDAN013111, partial [Ephemera danica]